MNEEPRSIILQTKQFPQTTRLLIHRYVEFSQNVGWKVMVIISLKIRNLGFESFPESGFWGAQSARGADYLMQSRQLEIYRAETW